MACRELVYDGKVIGHVCGPHPDNFKATDEVEIKWCFLCRKRTVFRLYIIDQEWYDPEPYWNCELCGMDGSRFPC